jgi:hypothetical protein
MPKYEKGEEFVYIDRHRWFQLNCYLDRAEHTGKLTCKDKTKETRTILFEWPDICLSQSDQIQGFCSALKTLPRKISTALAINNEYPIDEQSGSRIVQSISIQLKELCRGDSCQQNPSVSQAITDIVESLELLQNHLEARTQQEIKQSSSNLIDRIDPLHAACRLYLEFLQPEILKSTQQVDVELSLEEQLQRFRATIPIFSTVANRVFHHMSLKYEYTLLQGLITLPPLNHHESDKAEAKN